VVHRFECGRLMQTELYTDCGTGMLCGGLRG
jgi:hypothetical protein